MTANNIDSKEARRREKVASYLQRVFDRDMGGKPKYEKILEYLKKEALYFVYAVQEAEKMYEDDLAEKLMKAIEETWK